MNIILSLILSFTTFLFTSTDPDDESMIRIEWKEGYKLNWADFQGAPLEGKSYSAMTCSDLDVKSFKVDNQTQYKVTSSFMKKVSWTKSKSEKLLAHEQVHFDITELHARLLRKALSDVDRKLSKQEFKSLVDPVFAQWAEMEKNYDRETRHGLNKDKQAEWEAMVDRRIKALDAYKASPAQVPAEDAKVKTEEKKSTCTENSCSLH